MAKLAKQMRRTAGVIDTRTSGEIRLDATSFLTEDIEEFNPLSVRREFTHGALAVLDKELLADRLIGRSQDIAALTEALGSPLLERHSAFKLSAALIGHSSHSGTQRRVPRRRPVCSRDDSGALSAKNQKTS